jgi:hypothetical protein
MRYYFHKRSGDHVEADQTGRDLPDEEEAVEVAMQTAREVVTQSAPEETELEKLTLEVADEQQEVVVTLPVNFALGRGPQGS